MKKLSNKQKFKMKLMSNPNTRKKYLATKLLGCIFTTDDNYYFNVYNREFINKSTDKPYSLYQEVLKHSGQRGFSAKKVMKYIRVLRELDVSGITRSLNYSKLTERCINDLKHRYKNAINQIEKSRQLSKPISPSSAKLKKFKDSFITNKIKLPSESYKPDADYIGVEIEFITDWSGSDIKSLADKMRLRNFNLGTDGSIEPNKDDNDDQENSDDAGFEARILLINNPEYIKREMKKVCQLLNQINAYVNKSCGLHVHLDVRFKDDSERREIGKRFGRCLSVLSTLVPSSRRENSYCQLQVSSSDRYSAVNMTAIDRYQTIEIRLHSGTVDFLKITKWIELLNVIKNTENSTRFESLDSMIEGLSMTDDLSMYYYARFKKFNTDNNSRYSDESSISENSVLYIDQTSFTDTQSINTALAAI